MQQVCLYSKYLTSKSNLCMNECSVCETACLSGRLMFIKEKDELLNLHI